MKVKQEYLAGAVAVIAVVAVGGFFYVNGIPGTTPTGDAVKEAMELSTNSELEVLRVDDRGSLDRVVLSDGSNVINAYVTEDRRYLVQATTQGQVVQDFTSLENLTRNLQARNNFISCLDRENATFFGVVSSDQRFSRFSQMTQLQIRALGGTPALQLFGGTGPQQIQQLILDFNQTNGVVWQIGGDLSGGVHTVPMLEQRTPCTFEPDSGA